MPESISAPVPEPLTVTFPPEDATNEPADAVKVTVRLSPSLSTNVTADKSTLEAVSSVTVMSVGAPFNVGAVLETEGVKIKLSNAGANAPPLYVTSIESTFVIFNVASWP